MNKLGIIFCGYNTEKYINDSISTWVKLREDNPGKVILSAVSLPFAEYEGLDIFQDNTTNVLLELEYKRKIDKVFTRPKYIKENEARDLCLQYLLKKECDLIMLVDSDEIFTSEQISNIFDYVDQDKLIAWYSICYKNYIFTDKQYLSAPFTPPRIFRVNVGNFKLDKIYWDNDFMYVSTKTGQTFTNYQLAGRNIPKKVAFVKHYTWMNDEKSKQKIEYQNKHFGGTCSYAWDNEKGLIFNEEFYKAYSLKKPEVLTEE